MKKLLSVLALFSVAALSAQITLTSADAMQASDRFYLGTGYSIAPPWTAGVAGPSQTWNFTGATYDYTDTIEAWSTSWISPARTAPFPQSQLAVSSFNDTMYYDMVHTDASGFYVDGSSYYDSQFGLLSRHYQDPFAFMMFPLTYNNVKTDSAYSDFTQPIMSGNYDSLHDILTYITTFTVDAWGTVTTPLGTFQGLRVKRDMSYSITQSYHDTLTGWDTATTYTASDRQYEWWVNGIGFPVVRLMVDLATDSIQTYVVLTTLGTGVHESVLNETRVFPNPATDNFSFESAPGSNWELMDVNGNLVSSGVSSSSKTEVNVSGLPAGIYFLRIAEQGELKKTVKVCVW
jgi:hypothetical protein